MKFSLQRLIWINRRDSNPYVRKQASQIRNIWYRKNFFTRPSTYQHTPLTSNVKLTTRFCNPFYTYYLVKASNYTFRFPTYLNVNNGPLYPNLVHYLKFMMCISLHVLKCSFFLYSLSFSNNPTLTYKQLIHTSRLKQKHVGTFSKSSFYPLSSTKHLI